MSSHGRHVLHLLLLALALLPDLARLPGSTHPPLASAAAPAAAAASPSSITELLSLMPRQPKIAIVNTMFFHSEIVAGLVEATAPFLNTTTYFLNPDIWPGKPSDLGFIPFIQDVKCEQTLPKPHTSHCTAMPTCLHCMSLPLWHPPLALSLHSSQHTHPSRLSANPLSTHLSTLISLAPQQTLSPPASPFAPHPSTPQPLPPGNTRSFNFDDLGYDWVEDYRTYKPSSAKKRKRNPNPPFAYHSSCPDPGARDQPPFDLMLFVSPEWNLTVVEKAIKWVSRFWRALGSGLRVQVGGECDRRPKGHSLLFTLTPSIGKEGGALSPRQPPHFSRSLLFHTRPLFQPFLRTQGKPSSVLMMIHNGDAPQIKTLLTFGPSHFITLAPHVSR